MKRVLAILLLLSVGFVLGVSWKELNAHAASGGGVPVGNGDVNGDGAIDISDAVYTLSWLFTGGKAPVAIECPPPGGGSLPATSQTRCYDASGNVINCASTAYPGQDGFYKAGCPYEGRFYPDVAWLVHFGFGDVSGEDGAKSGRNVVRAVRAAR